jgi:hypothetical protein
MNDRLQWLIIVVAVAAVVTFFAWDTVTSNLAGIASVVAFLAVCWGFGSFMVWLGRGQR